MTLGASLHDAVEFALLLIVGIGAGLLYILLFLARSSTKSNTLRFIFDFGYVIIVAGVFVTAMLHINMFRVRYYHIMALMIGILLAGVAPTLYLARYERAIFMRVERLKVRIKDTRLYHIIKK